MSTIAQKAFDGIIWSSLQRFGTMGITLVSNIILARLLTPDDYGCVGMLMIFISLANTFIDGGFGSALIQKKQPAAEDYSTIFYWNIVLSLILYIVLYFAAPLIAAFYKIPLLTPVLRVQGIVLIFNALSIIQQNQLRKKLDFKSLAIVNIISASIALTIAIMMAYQGMGVWSLVGQQISLSLFNAILFWIVSGWRPLQVFSWSSFKELFSFGGYILLSHLVSTFSNEIQGLLIGRRFNAYSMGLYTQAYRLEGSAATAVSGVIDQVTYPVLSSLQDDTVKLKVALKKFIQIPAFICCPFLAIMIVIAKPLIILLYTEKWSACVPYFQILCCAGVAVCLQGVANNAIAAIGKSNVFFWWTIVKRLLTVVLCVVGIFIGGMTGLLWACVLGAWGVYFINAYLVDRHIGYSFVAQILDIAPFILLSTILGLGVYYTGIWLAWNGLMSALMQAIMLIISYVYLSKLFRFQVIDYIISLVRARLKFE